MRHQRFICIRLSIPHMTWSKPRLLTETFTTAAFDRSSFRQFEASSHKAAPKDLPPSFVQHRAPRRVLDTIPSSNLTGRTHTGGLGKLDVGRFHGPTKALCRIQASLLGEISVVDDEIAPRGGSLHGPS